MKWQCALLQRWLPEYPDGDLPAWGKRWLDSHLTHCAACRQELVGLREVVAAMEASLVADPGPEFWQDFSRNLHLKLVETAQTGQAAPAPPPARPPWLRLPYLLGAPAVVVLMVWVAVQFTGSGLPVRNQAMVRQPEGARMAEVAKPAAAPPAAAPRMAAVAPRSPEAPPSAAEVPGVAQVAAVALEEDEPLAVEEEDLPGWGLDAELAGMSDHEKEIFLNKLDQQKKDGSCIEGFSYCSWG